MRTKSNTIGSPSPLISHSGVKIISLNIIIVFLLCKHFFQIWEKQKLNILKKSKFVWKINSLLDNAPNCQVGYVIKKRIKPLHCVSKNRFIHDFVVETSQMLALDVGSVFYSYCALRRQLQLVMGVTFTRNSIFV